MAYVHWLCANLNIFRGEHDHAEQNFEKALINIEDSSLNVGISSLGMLASLAEKKGDISQALVLTKKVKVLNQYNYNKAQSEIGLIFAEVSRLNEENYGAKADLLLLNQEKRFLLLTVILAAILLVVLSFFILQQVKIKNILKIKNEKITASENAIREKNKELQESLIYAKLIQSSILPTSNLIANSFEEHFVLYAPKDIVSGDFYWFDKIGDHRLFAVADCTGHGVPGALTSMVCYNALNKAVYENEFLEPSSILDETRDLVIQELGKNVSNISDGMDISLCSIKHGELAYAGANNNMFIVRNGEIIELKADKMPIGKFPIMEPFKEVKMKLKKGDIIYLFSDGYCDQFGGNQGKKLKKSRFKAFLSVIWSKPVAEQQKYLSDKLHEWMDGFEQVDDICVIGIRY